MATARRAMLLLIAVIVAACGSTSPSTAPTPPHSLAPSPSAAASAIPSLAVATPNSWTRLDSIEQPEGFEKILINGNGKMQTTCAPCHPPVDTIMTGVASGPSGLVAVGWIIQGFHGVVWTSKDGSAWKLENDFPEQSLFTAVATNGRRFVAVGRNGPGSIAWSSPDGGSWQRTGSTGAFAASPLRIGSVTSWRGGFVAAGYQGTEAATATAAFMVSADGLSWKAAPSQASFQNARVTSVVGGPKFLVAVGTTGPSDSLGPAAVWTSRDGLAWTRVPDSPALHDARPRSVTYAPGIGFVAVGENLKGSFGMALVSRDGRTWTRAPSGPDLGRSDIQVRMYGVAPGGPGGSAGSGVVAVGTETIGVQYGRATVWTSRDGLHWQLGASSVSLLDGEMNAVARWGSKLLAVGDRGEPDTYISQVWVSPAAWNR